MLSTNQTDNSLKKILVIEDEGDMCLLLDILLNAKSVKVDHVKSLSAAKAFLKGEQPDIILLDNRLPDGYGIDFIGYIKATYPATKIVMISGVDAAARDLALEVGADNFLLKPFTKQQLHHTIDHLLN